MYHVQSISKSYHFDFGNKSVFRPVLNTSTVTTLVQATTSVGIIIITSLNRLQSHFHWRCQSGHWTRKAIPGHFRCPVVFPSHWERGTYDVQWPRYGRALVPLSTASLCSPSLTTCPHRGLPFCEPAQPAICCLGVLTLAAFFFKNPGMLFLQPSSWLPALLLLLPLGFCSTVTFLGFFYHPI